MQKKNWIMCQKERKIKIWSGKIRFLWIYETICVRVADNDFTIWFYRPYEAIIQPVWMKIQNMLPYFIGTSFFFYLAICSEAKCLVWSIERNVCESTSIESTLKCWMFFAVAIFSQYNGWQARHGNSMQQQHHRHNHQLKMRSNKHV